MSFSGRITKGWLKFVRDIKDAWTWKCELQGHVPEAGAIRTAMKHGADTSHCINCDKELIVEIIKTDGQTYQMKIKERQR